MSESLFTAREVKAALWLLLGDGLDAAGKEKWLTMRLAEGMSAEQIFADALRYIDGASSDPFAGMETIAGP